MIALSAQEVSFRYGAHLAVDRLNLQVEQNEIYALLGPNGCGKTTFFRLVSTLLPLQDGTIQVFGVSLAAMPDLVRSLIGVVFQSSSCDAKLTVRENLLCQAALYGLSKKQLRDRVEEVTSNLGLMDRLDWKVEQLSGGLVRRVDIAKSLLHTPRLLLLDEPSAGLDPSARIDLWHALTSLREKSDVTILMTTHLLEEADKADRIGIVYQGHLLASDSPFRLREELGSRVLGLQSTDAKRIQTWCEQRGCSVQVQEKLIQVTGPDVVDLISPMNRELGDCIQSITFGQPSLEDVFLAKTGHRFWDVSSEVAASGKKKPGRGRK